MREKKRWILRERLATEVSRLVRISSWLANRDGRGPVLTEVQLREATIELAACFPVYRTYLCAETDGDLEPPESAAADESALEVDVALVRTAVDLARRERPDLETAFEFLRGLLMGRMRGGDSADWVMRFQQLTGPAMAKGVEDTAYYCYNRFIGLNEVGGDPSRFGLSLGGFHQACAETSLRWPQGMLTTSTHDTKRGEDVRARLALLSEIPRRWATAVRRWSVMNEAHREHGWPDRNAEYFFYQTLVGAWPLSVDRALACMEKAAREAGQHTDWIQRHDEYETALGHFVERTLADPGFLKSVEEFLAPLIGAGHLNALAQTVLKLTCPGVPDLYQGTELWDLNLVDPDNRRPVDFVARRDALEEMRQRIEADGLSALLSELLQSPADGGIKLFVIHRILVFRRERERLFREGRYVPLAAAGRRSEHVCAFARALGGMKVVVVVPKRVLSFADGCGCQTLGAAVWGDTVVILPRARAGRVFRNVFTEERVVAREEDGHASLRLAELFARFPVALCEMFDPSMPSMATKGESP